MRKKQIIFHRRQTNKIFQLIIFNQCQMSTSNFRSKNNNKKHSASASVQVDCNFPNKYIYYIFTKKEKQKNEARETML